MVDGFPGEFPYRTSVTVQNLSSQATSTSGGGDVLFLDDDDFLLHIDDVSISLFLDQSGPDVTDEDLTLSANGGIAGFATRDTTTSIFVDDFSFNGPASRAIFHFSRRIGAR